MKKYIINSLFLIFGMYVSAQCVDPTALTATAITETTALLGWTEGSTPAATQWEVEVVDQGVAPTGTATATTTVIPFLATSLPSGQSYDFYVRSDCGGGTFSGWAGPFTFTTLPCNFSTISITNTNQCLEYCFFPNGPQFGTFFDFNSGTLPTGWSASPYAVGQPCATNMVDNTDYFWAQATNGAGIRQVTTNVVDVSLGGTVRFYMRYGSDDPSNGCEDPDLVDEGVFLQYSIDGGATWVNINTWNPTGVLTDPLYQWLEYTETIPAAAQTATTVFRWYQPQNSGTDFDNWGLDNVLISANTSGNFVWDFGDGNTSTLQNPCHTFATAGDYTITLSVNAPNCIASSSAVLTVADTVPPVANCQDFTVTLDASGNASITAADIDNGSTDNCGIASMTVSPNTFTSANGGQNPVVFTVTDTAGNVSTCTAVVNVPYNCGSVFTDTGGATADYSNSENVTWVFTPNNAGEFVQLNFSEFNTENRFDGMAIYNGPDITFPLIDSGSTGNFNNMPDGVWTGLQGNTAEFAATSITSSDPSGALTVVFMSDSSVTRPGWQATINCVTCPGVSNVVIGNITASTAEISWVDTAASQWEIEIVPVGTAPTGVGVVTSSNPYIATGLNSGTEYEVIIRSLCSATDLSSWIGSTFFTTALECGNVFTDTGGVTGNYSNGEDLTWVFSPSAPGTFVTLDFTAVDIESGWDQLDIYDGSDMTAPLLAGNVLGPVTVTATNPSGMLFVHFTSDGSVTRSGWEADINCATILGCGDIFTDTGGVASDYGNSENETWVIFPSTPGVFIELNFTQFNTEFGWDGIMIYNGPDTTYPIIDSGYIATAAFPLLLDGAWTGVLGDSTAPTTITATNPTGVLTIVFTSGGNTTFPGWESVVECVNPCADPTNLVTSNATGFTMDLMWTENGSATQWEVEVVPTGTAATGVGTVVMTPPPYTVTGLLPDTTYDFYVTAICNPGVSESNQVGPVTDSTICDASVFTGVTLNATQTIDTTSTPNQITLCTGNTVDLSLSGGFIPSSETYQWQLDGVDIAGETNNTYTGVSTPGSYGVIVTIGNCIETFLVDVVADEAIITIVVHDDCTTTTTVADGAGNPVTGGTFTFNPQPTDSATIDPVTGELQIMSAGTSYTVEYTTVLGCVSTYTLMTASDYGCIIPSAISPNGDGINDTFDISFIQAEKLTIFNRYGKEVYTKNEYRNEWGGNSDAGDELPVGTYYYVIKQTNDSPITGWVYINREK